jgi:hypothetical protein
MSVYGDMLPFFYEQARIVDYFTMIPQPVASFTERQLLGKIRCIFQYMKKGELRREEETLADTNVPTIWTNKKLKLGNFFISFDDEVFRIVRPSDWHHEGGFYLYELETVVGNIDEQESFDYVNLGQNSYG